MKSLVLLVSLFSAVMGWTSARAADPLLPPKGPVLLTITGRIEQVNAPGEARFDREMLDELGRASFKTKSQLSRDKAQTFEGVPLRAVLERVGARGSVMKALALNDYEIAIPFEDLRYEPILSTHVDGQLLTTRDKGPLWIAYPRDAHGILQDVRYDARWVWQLHRLSIE